MPVTSESVAFTPEGVQLDRTPSVGPNLNLRNAFMQVMTGSSGTLTFGSASARDTP
jgi:hypothetical protein